MVFFQNTLYRQIIATEFTKLTIDYLHGSYGNLRTKVGI